MGGLIGSILGFTLGCCGFLVMRNPMRLALLYPGSVGYYQRIVLDRWQRIPMRLLGALISLFGLVIFTAALGGLLRVRLISGASTGLLVLLWLVFVGAWGLGLVSIVIQLVRKKSLGWMDWFETWKRGVQLGPIAVYPPITPAMQRESQMFTVGFCLLVAAAVMVGPYLP
jgi:hypothetical protein